MLYNNQDFFYLLYGSIKVVILNNKYLFSYEDRYVEKY